MNNSGYNNGEDLLKLFDLFFAYGIIVDDIRILSNHSGYYKNVGIHKCCLTIVDNISSKDYCWMDMLNPLVFVQPTGWNILESQLCLMFFWAINGTYHNWLVVWNMNFIFPYVSIYWE